jgi:hypothetical protein
VERSTTVILVPLTAASAEVGEKRRPKLPELTSPADGVIFDIDSDGTVEAVAWSHIDSDVGLLVIDRNANGRIDNGSEVFGSRMLPQIYGGFTALEKFEGQRVGAIDNSDPLYARLLLWADRNHNGQSEESELLKVRDILAKIGLGYFRLDIPDDHGNRFLTQGWSVASQDFRGRPDDRIRPLYEVSLAVQQ